MIKKSFIALEVIYIIIISMEHEEHKETKKNKDYLLPASILIAAALIAGAVFFNAGKQTGNNNEENNVVGNEAKNPNVASERLPKNVRPISDKDHKLGPDSAPIKIIGFTDLECPYCKEYHLVLKQVMKEMPGKIQFILRNFPLAALHKQAKQEAIATECAANLGGENAFWNYVDKIFESTKSNDGLDLTLLPKFATEVGIDQEDFKKCLTSGKFDKLIQTNIDDGNNSGLQGTPYSVVIAPNGQYLPLNGYMPVEQFKTAMEEVLNQK
jgi:protein-disulfide isomerase